MFRTGRRTCNYFYECFLFILRESFLIWFASFSSCFVLFLEEKEVEIFGFWCETISRKRSLLVLKVELQHWSLLPSIALPLLIHRKVPVILNIFRVKGWWQRMGFLKILFLYRLIMTFYPLQLFHFLLSSLCSEKKKHLSAVPLWCTVCQFFDDYLFIFFF